MCTTATRRAANQQNPAGVWDSNYEAVWHLPNGTTLSANDSTANANNAVALNGTAAAAGEIDGAASLNGTSNYILVSNSSSLNGWSQQTVSLWVNAQTNMPTYSRLIEKGANDEWTLSFVDNQLTLREPGDQQRGHHHQPGGGRRHLAQNRRHHGQQQPGHRHLRGWSVERFRRLGQFGARHHQQSLPRPVRGRWILIITD